jgi:hypothetical protein
MLPSFRISAFPDFATEWRVEILFPDYSGGTVLDLHQLPFYALASTQDLAKQSSTVQGFGCQGSQDNLTS